MSSEGVPTSMTDIPLSTQPSPPHPTPPPPSSNIIPEPVTNPHVSPQSSSPTPQNPEPVPIQPLNTHTMQTRSKNQIVKPKTKFSLTIQTTPFIPTTLNQALGDEKWRNSMSEEFDAVNRNHTYDLVPPRPNQNVTDTKWIYTLKCFPDGTVRRNKSRLVARGYNQRYGIDYAETFSPVIKSTTVRLVLEQAVRLNWLIRQLDVNNAFLQGTLKDEVYVSQPPGFIDEDRPHYVCKQRKTLYGLKQASHAWYGELKRALLEAGLVNSAADTSLFIFAHGQSLVYILIYVDDIIVTGNSSALVNKMIGNLVARFSIKDLGDLSYFLGIEAHRTDKGMHLM